MLQRNILRQSRGVASPLRSSLLASQRSQLSLRLPAPTRARILSRWYSDAAADAQAAKPDSDAAAASSSASEASKAPAGEQDQLKKDLEAKNKEVSEFKDKYLRSVADFRNLQERTKREQQAAKDFALQRFARDLIESVDNLDLALTNTPADKLVQPGSSGSSVASGEGAIDVHKELRQLHGGLKMTETVLMNTLKKHGLERFDPSENGDEFDPNLHEATFQAPQPDKKDGTVFHTTQKGFMLNGRVLRAAKVGVVKNS